MKQENGWVIEFLVPNGSLYWSGSFALGANQNAIRFSRKEDAERTMNYLLANELLTKEIKPIVTEHVWL